MAQATMKETRTIPSIAIALMIVATSALTGCHDPEFKIQQAQRDQRVRGLISDAERIDRYRRGHIDWLFETDARLNDCRARHLRTTIDTFESVEEQRRRKWEKAPPSESIVIRRIIEGRPEQIPSVWARMIY